MKKVGIARLLELREEELRRKYYRIGFAVFTLLAVIVVCSFHV